MEKKQFRVEIITKGSFDVEIAPVDTNEYSVEEIQADDFYEDFMNYSDYIVNCGLGDEWSGQFEMKVYDENDNVVFECDDFSEIPFIVESEQAEEEDFPSTIDPMKAVQEWEKRWEKEGITEKPGIYAVSRHEIKWLTFVFVVEDERFDPTKLLFVSNRKLEGLVYDYMTDPGHIFYDDRFVETEIDDDSLEEYGHRFYIMKKHEEGWWEEIREVD